MLTPPLLITTVAAGALVLAIILRISGVPGRSAGAAALGGVVAGILGGPLVLGAIEPGAWSAAYVGGVPEAGALSELTERQQADLQAMRLIDVSPSAIEEMVRDHAEERAPFAEALADARADHRDRLGVLASALGGAFLFLGGCVLAAHPPTRPRPVLRAIRASLGRERWGAVVSVMMLQMLTLTLLVVIFSDATWASVLLFSVLFTIPTIGPAVRGVALGHAAAGGAVTLTLLAAAAAGAPDLRPQPASVLIVVASFTLGWLAPLRPGARGRRRLRQITPLVAASAIGVVTAMLDVRTLVGSPEFWTFAIIAALLASDARWLAWRLGLAGEELAYRGPWSASGAIVNAGSGAAAVAIGAAFIGAPAMTDALLASLIIGAVAIGTTNGLRRRLGAVIDAGPDADLTDSGR